MGPARMILLILLATSLPRSSGAQMLKNLVARNPGFEGMEYRSIVRCVASGSVCMTEDGADAWMVQHIQAPEQARELAARGTEIFGVPLPIGPSQSWVVSIKFDRPKLLAG